MSAPAPDEPSPRGAPPWTRPDYGGVGIANLMASLLDALGAPGAGPGLAPCPWLDAARLREARHVVLLVIDGLGRAQLEDHAPGGRLAAARVGDLSSVFPSTTASAVTTFMTGDVPAQHGLVGWHLWFRALGVMGTPLPFTVRGSDVPLSRLGVDAPGLFGTRPLSLRLARRSVMIHPRHLCGTAYTEAHRGSAEVRGFQGLDAMVQAIDALCAEPEPSFCYAYWPELDSRSHVHGAGSARAGEHLRAIDRALAACEARLRGRGALLLVCADHGFVDTVPERRLHLGEHPQLAATLALPLGGEPRMAYCHVRDGAGADFEGYVREHLAAAAECRRAQELLDDGYLGPGAAHPDLLSRMGTHVLLMRENWSLTDRTLGERPFEQVGVHGGMSDAELRVPLCLLGE